MSGGEGALVTVTSYLPQVCDNALQAVLHGNDWRGISAVLEAGGFERVGLDRFYRIYCDLLARGIDPCGLRVLDIGCNNGLMARAFGMAGADALGIDSAVVDGQGRYAPLALAAAAQGGRCRLVRSDLLTLLDTTTATWDVVLMLSVAHHWRTGYAMSGTALYSEPEIERIFAQLARRCIGALYVECPDREPGFPSGAGLEIVEKHLPATHERVDLGYTIGPGGYRRRMFRVQF